jgi:CelD/BcsL family acetyltransferase involved in cellulose biosynthesis
MLRGDLIDRPDVDGVLRDGWDSLAVACARPFSSPAWMLAWWRHVRPAGAALRIVAVWDGDELAGILPFYAERSLGIIRFRLLASTTSAHVEPLARPGSEREIASVAAEVLSTAGIRPDVISLHGVSSASPWPMLLQRSLAARGGASLHRGSGMPAPHLTLEGRTYEEWFASLSGHRRSEFRRRRRRLEERGAVARLVEPPDEMVSGLRAFATLHHQRWDPRGGSGVLDPRVEAMLASAALELAPSLRFRLWSIEVSGRSISSSVFVAAGGALSYWLGGFDAGWAEFGPALETVRAALEHAWAVGDQTVDFGPGGQRYKYTFADGEDIVEPVDLVPRTSRYLRARVQLAPEQISSRVTALRHEAFRRLPPGVQQRAKAVRAQLRTHR